MSALWVGPVVSVLAAIAAALAVYAALATAPRTGLVQVPNERSSHRRPTPTGGGVGIVIGGTLAALAIVPQLSWSALPLVALGGGMGVLGLIDDVKPLPPISRLLGQFILAGLAFAMGPPLLLLQARLGLPGPPIALFIILVPAIVYWTNLFNFMDGIDGLAAMEAIFLLLASLGLILLSVPDPAALPLCWLFAALALSTLAFLAFNWQPARIFMGDVGSLYLGFMIAILALLAISQGWLTPWAWLILAALFVSDASVTLLRRLQHGASPFTAHRRHVYQLLSRRLRSHRRVVLIYMAINLAWLLPLAAVAQLAADKGPLLTGIAYAPLVLIAFLTDRDGAN